MILIIGGEGSGKRAYAASLGYMPEQMANAVLDDRPVLYNLQDLVARDPDSSAALMKTLLEKEAVLCNEVGSGVIPLAYSERAGREATGRLCVLLAQHAQKVIRMVCGIPVVIKQ